MLPTSLQLIVKLLEGRIRAESDDLAREMTFRVDPILEMPPVFGLMTRIRCGLLTEFTSNLLDRGLLIK